MSLDLESISS